MRVGVCLLLLPALTACSPSSDDSVLPDARDARDVPADTDVGPCDPLLCASRCVAAGYATGICRDNGSCACSEPECDLVECDEACRALGFDRGSCRSTGACACGDEGDGGTEESTGERCNDQVDNDGDGLVDEDCGCTLGTHQPCYTGALYTRNIGECRDGLQRCESLDGIQHWGPCEGDRRPGDETCNGLDDDCDFVADEGCGECVPTEFGAETSCTDSQDNDCDELADCFDPDCPPCCREEVCGDGIDNNCDDLVDEYCGTPCTPNEYFSIADCRDGNDNDCDGQTDCEDLDCIIACCTAELCADGNDNDCDGLIDCADPDCGSTCCTVLEACEDGVDNNCDGQADCEDPECCASAPCNVLPPCCPTCCVPGSIQRCYLPRYCSSYGWQTCKPDGTWGGCIEGGP
jgi:hypothetical protein